LVVAIHVAPCSRIPVRAAGDLGYRFDPGATRRNLTVDVGEIPTTPGARLVIGDVELEVVRVSAPCRLLTPGTIRVGDDVRLIPELAGEVRVTAGPPSQLAARRARNRPRGDQADIGDGESVSR
jgi:MOSC domain-containing protein YiiM